MKHFFDKILMIFLDFLEFKKYIENLSSGSFTKTLPELREGAAIAFSFGKGEMIRLNKNGRFTAFLKLILNMFWDIVHIHNIHHIQHIHFLLLEDGLWQKKFRLQTTKGAYPKVHLHW
jgi:hypothetical protein